MLNMISGSLITIAGFVGVALLYILLRSMFYTPPVDPHTKSIKGKIISINPTYINNKNSESAYTYINPLSAGISSLFVTFIGMHFKEYHIVGECKFHNELYTINSYILGRNIQLQNVLRKFTAKVGDTIEIKVLPNNPSDYIVSQDQFYK